MLKLTQMFQGKPQNAVYVSPLHVVAVYPDKNGNGCHVELTTNQNPEEPVLHVEEMAEYVASQPQLNP